MGSNKRFLSTMLAAVITTGCSGVNFQLLSSQGPDFSFVDYFEGHTRASGWFADRFGNVKRHFCGDFLGTMNDGVLTLDETLFYTDGIVEKRIWDVSVDDSGNFKAESDGLVGNAVGIQRGSGLKLQYVMNVLVSEGKYWKLDMNDYMFYQPDLSLHNSTEVNKWGVRLGNVSTQYNRHDGSETCAAMQEQAALLGGSKLKIAS